MKIFNTSLTIQELREVYKNAAIEYKMRPKTGFTQKAWAMSAVDKAIKKKKRKNA
jgi:hypothetical protein